MLQQQWWQRKKQDAVLAHLAEVGPLAVNVDASQWHSYTGALQNTQKLTNITRRNIWWLRLCSEHGSQSCGADGGKFSVLATFFSGYGIKPPGIQSFKLCPWYIKYTRWDILRMPGLWETVGELGEIWNYHKCREEYWKVWNRWLKFGK